MKRLVLITLFLLGSGPAYAEWVELTTNEQETMTVYANPDTIRRKGEIVTMWELYDLKATETNPHNQSYLSRKAKTEYDCDGERERSLILTDFSDHMGNGKVVSDVSFEGKDKWRPVQPDSIGKSLLEFACGKK